MTDPSLRVGIDASNIRRGGGVTHLTQLLRAADPPASGIGEVIVWARADVLARLSDRPWLIKRHLPVLDGPLVKRLLWQQRGLGVELRRDCCDVLFAPGGLLPHRLTTASVTMSRNMLPFEPIEAARFGLFSTSWFKMQLLRRGQVRSMSRADGLIFLSDYARTHVLPALGRGAREWQVIPHGLENRFFLRPRPAVAPEAVNGARPFRLLYVSTVDMYKHQWEVVRAAGELRRTGIPVHLDLIGSPLPGAMAKLDAAIAQVDPDGAFVTYHNSVPFEELHHYYQQADAFVYASSCENLPNILLEAMAAGLPIASSDMGPMPEVLGGAGVYFDPLDSGSIARAVQRLIDDAALRERLAGEAFERARSYSWTRCAADTFAFIASVAKHHARAA